MPVRNSWFAKMIASMLGNKPGKAGKTVKTRKTASVNSLSEESENSTSDTKECQFMEEYRKEIKQDIDCENSEN